MHYVSNNQQKQRTIFQEKKKPDESDLQSILSPTNSYLGLMKHYRSYYIRRKLFQNVLQVEYFNYFYLSGGYGKLVRKKWKVRKKEEKWPLIQDRPCWGEVLARRH